MSDHKHEHKSHTKEYVIVFFVLTFLTLLELMIPGSKIESHHKMIGLIGLAMGKACIVAYFYMHLKEETRWMKLIACIPLSAALYAAGLILESMYR
ncbi:cytochrome C oxidase subunit IV family protein [Bacteriovorax sp. PP10]|uniref:Cytochrome C oxidase subunit IV family protein n=1 Tax=Bacteriovorax antarcticus TaxID=3088717 RepID=A0ABU5VND3_9BACT|nr:cytochrome C oxidase subunit IV family protein [Bacteriovorax sp. PP10]MEA9354568.1 cytochrome C oxidase subunit IV family protein [Bacteriovorax sp. PP10]